MSNNLKDLVTGTSNGTTVVSAIVDFVANPTPGTGGPISTGISIPVGSFVSRVWVETLSPYAPTILKNSPADSPLTFGGNSDQVAQSFTLPASVSLQQLDIWASNTDGTLGAAVLNSTVTGSDVFIGGVNQIGQSFTLSSSTDMTSVSLWLANPTGETGFLNVEIYAVDGFNLPTGGVLAGSGSISALDDVTSSPIPAPVKFVLGTTLGAGTYALVLRADTPLSGNITIGTTTTFATEVRSDSVDSGSSWTAGAGAVAFSINVVAYAFIDIYDVDGFNFPTGPSLGTSDSMDLANFDSFQLDALSLNFSTPLVLPAGNYAWVLSVPQVLTGTINVGLKDYPGQVRSSSNNAGLSWSVETGGFAFTFRTTTGITSLVVRNPVDGAFGNTYDPVLLFGSDTSVTGHVGGTIATGAPGMMQLNRSLGTPIVFIDAASPLNYGGFKLTVEYFIGIPQP